MTGDVCEELPTNPWVAGRCGRVGKASHLVAARGLRLWFVAVWLQRDRDGALLLSRGQLPELFLGRPPRCVTAAQPLQFTERDVSDALAERIEWSMTAMWHLVPLRSQAGRPCALVVGRWIMNGLGYPHDEPDSEWRWADPGEALGDLLAPDALTRLEAAALAHDLGVLRHGR